MPKPLNEATGPGDAIKAHWRNQLILNFDRQILMAGPTLDNKLAGVPNAANNAVRLRFHFSASLRFQYLDHTEPKGLRQPLRKRNSKIIKHTRFG